MLTTVKPTKKQYHMFGDNVLFWDYKGQEHALWVQAQEDALSPREYMDPASVMFCCHPRYTLGDAVEQKTPGEFWAWLVDTAVPTHVIAERLRNRTVACVEMDELYPDLASESDEDIARDFIALIEDEETIDKAMAMCKDYVAILPLWLYDHSGISMSCGARTYPYNDQWDSSAIGWIVMTRVKALDNLTAPVMDENGKPVMETAPDGIMRPKYAHVDNSNWEKTAIRCMQSEVEEYDRYLTGDVYGYTVYNRPAEAGPMGPEEISESDTWTEIDSCWGFYGSDILENDIAESVGRGLKEAIESENYRTGNMKTYTTVHYVFSRHTERKTSHE